MAAGSIDTKNKKRDEHLRSADFFDAASHPDITFTVDGVRPNRAVLDELGSQGLIDWSRAIADAT